jgi:predicted membrane-bound mannosyltransferase
VVAFAFYWGFVSVLGYPIITDIKAPWAAVNAAVPLAVPAGVGLAIVARWAIGAYRREEFVDVGLAAVLLLLVSAQVAAVGHSAVYVDHSSGDNELVQFAQPGSDVRPLIETLRKASAQHSGPDVIMYGSYFAETDPHGTRDPECVKWFNALPLPWYFETTDASVACARDQETLRGYVQRDQPPVVIARSNVRDVVADDLPNYHASYYAFRAWGTNSTVFVHEDWAGVDNGMNVTAEPPGNATTTA